MTNPDQPRVATAGPPAGTAGDGQDNYPTFHDRPGDRLSTAPGARPTAANLPQSRRSRAGPLLLGVLAFAAVVVVYILWSLFNVAETTGEAMSPGDAAAPASGAPGVPGSAIDSAEQPGAGEPALDRDSQPQTGSPTPAGTTPAPGSMDVPGGAASGQPAAPTAAQ